MRAKVTEEDSHLLACIYASSDAVPPEELRRWAEELAQGFRRFCGAAKSEAACSALTESDPLSRLQIVWTGQEIVVGH